MTRNHKFLPSQLRRVCRIHGGAATEQGRRDAKQPDIEFPSSTARVDQDGDAGKTPRLGRSLLQGSVGSGLNVPVEPSQVHSSPVQANTSGAVYVERTEPLSGAHSGSITPDEQLSQQLSSEQENETA